MKKNLKNFFIVLLLLFIQNAKADVWLLRSCLELFGQYNLLFNTKNLLSIESNYEKYVFNSGYSIGFNGVLLFGIDDRIYGFYVKKDHIDTKNKSELLFSKDKNYNIISDESWGLHYLGCGLRKYFIDDFIFNSILPYLAVKNFSNMIIASGTMEGKGAFLGLNIEGGLDYWFSNEFAVSIKTGYRFCEGIIDVVRKEGDLKPAGISDVEKSNIDYSGVFINIGISFLFQRYD